MSTQTCAVTVEETTVEDGRAMLDRETLAVLSITREQFLQALDRGEYDNTDREDVIRLVMLAPFGR